MTYRQRQKDWAMHLQQQRKGTTGNSQQKWLRCSPIPSSRMLLLLGFISLYLCFH